MLLVLRALIVVGLATVLHTAKDNCSVPVKSRSGTKLKGQTVRLTLDQSVQLHIPRSSASSIANLSLSPWTYCEDMEKWRIPERIFQAQCLTSGCLSLQGGGEDLSLEAKPIKYQVLVLRRVPRVSKKNNGKKYKFKLGTKVITVGCTCVRPSVIPQQ